MADAAVSSSFRHGDTCREPDQALCGGSIHLKHVIRDDKSTGEIGQIIVPPSSCADRRHVPLHAQADTGCR